MPSPIVVINPERRVYVVTDCPACGASKVHDAEMVLATKFLPCPCGHEIEMTNALAREIKDNLDKARRTVH